MLLEEKYPHLKNPDKAEWRVVAVRSLIFILISILITAAAYIYGPKKRGEVKSGTAQNSASTRSRVSPSEPDL